jgi:hypothetical protein
MGTAKKQYTIRGVNSEVDRALRQVARERRLSLNAYLVQELGRIAEEALDPGPHHDLDFAIGSMSDGQIVDAALAEFSKVDEALWR